MPIHNKHFCFYLDHESDPYESRGEFNEHRPEFNQQADEFNEHEPVSSQRLDFGLDRNDVLVQAKGEFKQRPAVFGVWDAIAAFNLSARHRDDGHRLCSLPILQIARNADNFGFGHRLYQRA